jgi:hypothetical protein
MWKEACMQALTMHPSTGVSSFKTRNLEWGNLSYSKYSEGYLTYLVCN